MSTTPATPHSNPTQTSHDINILTTFLSNAQLSSPTTPIATISASPTQTTQPTPPTQINPTVLIICPSAILHQATRLFTYLQTTSTTSVTTTTTMTTIHTLIFTGGKGHSTTHLHAAIQTHPRYRTLADVLDRPLTDLPEAQLWYLIFVHFFDGEAVARLWAQGRGLRVLVEDRSENCGANAVLSRRVLEDAGVVLGSATGATGMMGPGNDGGGGGGGGGRREREDVVIMQDPTMCLRTKASFEQVYADPVAKGTVRFWTWPCFVPSVMTVVEGNGASHGAASHGVMRWDAEAMGMSDVDVGGLWDMKRFYGLVLGEIPRLRDDVEGYGPNGKGFIAHVHVPDEVERVWERLMVALDFER